jgi:hypothetical protein
MNSLTLKEIGFSEFFPLNGISFTSLPYNKGSVFVIIDNTQSGKPTSDILFIGKSKKPTKRIFGGYLSGYGGKSSKRINSKLFDDDYIGKTSISWILSDKPKTMQGELLEKFKKEHGAYPIWNAPKKVPPVKKPKATVKTVKPRSKPKPA